MVLFFSSSPNLTSPNLKPPQALELYGAEQEGVLSDAVERLVETVCQWMAAAPAAESEPELLTAFFEM